MRKFLLCASLVLLNPCFAEETHFIDNPQKKESSQSPQTQRRQKVRKKRFVTRDNKSTNQTKKQQQQPAKPVRPVKPAPVKPVQPAPKVETKKTPVKPDPVKPTPKPVLPKPPQNQIQVKKGPEAPKKPQVVVEEKKEPIVGFEGLVEPENKTKESAHSAFPIEESRGTTTQERSRKYLAPLSSEPLNKKETSSLYDRNINRETHHSVSEDTPQNSEDQESPIREFTAQSTESNNVRIEKPVVPKKCDTPFHQAHIGLRHSEAKGVGYRHGYTTLEGFGIWDGNTDFMPFIDLRAHVFDQGKFAGNAGVGGRTFFSSMNQVLGYYLYYDVRQENHGLTVQQLSPGIEVLGKRMEYRMNAYFPIIKNSHKYNFDFDRFDDHHIILKSKQKQAMTGVDAEVGAHLTQDTKYDVYAGAGPYYFTSSNASTWGGKVRLLGRFKEYVSLEATYTYDHLFGSIIQGSVGLSLPLGGKIKRKDKNCASGINLALSRAAFAPYRFEIPVVKRATRRSEAINPATDDPWVVWFVDNTSSSDGTFESPFPTLVQAQNASGPNDMIYVFPGDGTSKGMDAGITLQNGQTLFGSGISHKIKTQHGKIKIPALSTSYPLITNTGMTGGGNVVTLADGNNVSGLNIFVTQPAASGIISNPGTNGATITRNIINGGDRGISLSGHGNIIVGNNVVSGVNLGTNGIIVLTDNGTFMKATINNNVVQGYVFAISFGPDSTTDISTADINVTGNIVSNFSEGISQNPFYVNSNVSIIGNTLINNNNNGFLGNGINLEATNSQPNLDFGQVSVVDNFVITSPGTAGTFGVNLTLFSSGFLSQKCLISNNLVTGFTNGINVGSAATDTLCATITNNIAIQAATHALSVTATGSGVVNIDNFTGNVAPNISLTGNVNFVPEGTCE